jgi:hypothetical protein
MARITFAVLVLVVALVAAKHADADPYDPNNVPFLPTSEKYRAFLESYAKVEGPKALAINRDTGDAALSSKKANAAEARRIALQHCEWIARSPCILYAVDNDVQSGVRTSDPIPSIQYGLASFDQFAIPFIPEEVQRRIGESYSNRQKNQVFVLALHPTGIYARVTGSNEASVRNRAAKDCREAAKEDCFFYWVGDKMTMVQPAPPPKAALVGPLKVPPAGPFYEGFYPLEDGLKVPLPAGRWASFGEDLTADPNSGNKQHYVVLIDISASSSLWEIHIGFVERTSTLARDSGGGYEPSPNCERKDFHLVKTQANYRGGIQDCWFVAHDIPQYAASKWPTENKLNAFYQANGIAVGTLIDVGYHFANYSNQLNLGYWFNPVAAGLRRDSNLNYSLSDWHPGNAATNPQNSAYIEKLKAWGAAWYPFVKAAFDKKAPPEGLVVARP